MPLIAPCSLELFGALLCFRLITLKGTLHAACGAVVSLDIGITVRGPVLFDQVICLLLTILSLGGLVGFMVLTGWTMPFGVPRWRGKSGSVVLTLSELVSPALTS